MSGERGGGRGKTEICQSCQEAPKRDTIKGEFIYYLAFMPEECLSLEMQSRWLLGQGGVTTQVTELPTSYLLKYVTITRRKGLDHAMQARRRRLGQRQRKGPKNDRICGLRIRCRGVALCRGLPGGLLAADGHLGLGAVEPAAQGVRRMERAPGQADEGSSPEGQHWAKLTSC